MSVLKGFQRVIEIKRCKHDWKLMTVTDDGNKIKMKCNNCLLIREGRTTWVKTFDPLRPIEF